MHPRHFPLSGSFSRRRPLSNHRIFPFCFTDNAMLKPAISEGELYHLACLPPGKNFVSTAGASLPTQRWRTGGSKEAPWSTAAASATGPPLAEQHVVVSDQYEDTGRPPWAPFLQGVSLARPQRVFWLGSQFENPRTGREDNLCTQANRLSACVAKSATIARRRSRSGT
jgi:hypothetical protein